MKIVKSTEEKLVIRREESTSTFELICLAVGVNVLVTLCFIAISENFPPLRNESFTISIAIGWLLVHSLFPEDEINSSYLLTVIFGSIPFLGVASLSVAALSLLQFPQIASLTFDKSKNLLTIKYSKILFWHPSTQYALDQIIESQLASKEIFIGTSAGVTSIPVVQLARRRRNGKIVWKTVLAGANKQDTVYQINEFLSRPLKQC